MLKKSWTIYSKNTSKNMDFRNSLNMCTFSDSKAKKCHLQVFPFLRPHKKSPPTRPYLRYGGLFDVRQLFYTT